MTDEEIVHGRVSMLRKTRKLTERGDNSISIKGLKSFTLKKDNERGSRRSGNGLADSLLGKDD